MITRLPVYKFSGLVILIMVKKYSIKEHYPQKDFVFCVPNCYCLKGLEVEFNAFCVHK